MQRHAEQAQATPAGPSILVLSPPFLRRWTGRLIRGIEIFDLHLVRTLAEEGCRVTVPATKGWGDTFDEHWAGMDVRIVRVPSTKSTLAGAFVGAIRAGKHDGLILANVARGLVPPAKFLRMRKRYTRGCVIAHQEPKMNAAEAHRDLGLNIVAVSDDIAGPYKKLMPKRLVVRYGLPNAERFHPPRPPKGDHDPVRFCLIGEAEKPYKGADTAIEAFGMLPTHLRERAELHLIAYRDPPKTSPPGVVAYAWQSADAMPDLLRTMDVGVVPSRIKETFSQAAVQHMLTGLPILVTPMPVLVEKAEPPGEAPAGVVAHNAKELSVAMARMIEDPHHRHILGRRARELALERFVWDSSWLLREVLRLPA